MLDRKFKKGVNVFCLRFKNNAEGESLVPVRMHARPDEFVRTGRAGDRVTQNIFVNGPKLILVFSFDGTHHLTRITKGFNLVLF